MAYKLIKAILFENSFPRAAFIPNLRARLATKSGSLNTDGGLGSDYHRILPFLILDKDEVVALNIQGILELSSDFLKEGRKIAHKRGICLALLAVYSDQTAVKLDAYKRLAELSSSKGLLSSKSIYARCEGSLKPAPLTGEFLSTDELSWSWELCGKEKVLSYEKERQHQIQIKEGGASIRAACLILGLDDKASLDGKHLVQIVAFCKARIKTLSEWSLGDIENHPIVKTFNEAENRLLQHLYVSKNEFFSTDQLSWSWELNNKARVLSYEAARQQQIKDLSGELTIHTSFLLLGLSEGPLPSAAKIAEVATLCKARIKILTDLSNLEVKSHPLQVSFNQAEKMLLQYLSFNAFNYKNELLGLEKAISQVASNNFSEYVLFETVQKKIKNAYFEIERMVAIVHSFVEVEHRYVDEKKIKDRLGEKIGWSPQQFELQRKLKVMADQFWHDIVSKIKRLISSADSILNRTLGTSSLSQPVFDEMILLIQSIDAALLLVGRIQGDATEEATVLFSAATDSDTHKANLQRQLAKLKQRTTQEEDGIKAQVKKAVLLLQTIAATDSPVPDCGYSADILDQQSQELNNLDSALVFLRNLQKGQLRIYTIAENDVKQIVSSQVTSDEVAQKLSGVLAQLDNDQKLKAMKHMLGRQYNVAVPAEISLRGFLKQKEAKGEDLQGVVTMLLEGLADQGISLKVKAKEIIPPPTYMTMALLQERLQQAHAQKEAARILLIDKLNADVQQRISPAIENYEAARKAIALFFKNTDKLTGSRFLENESLILMINKTRSPLAGLVDEITSQARADYFSTTIRQQLVQLKNYSQSLNEMLIAVRKTMNEQALGRIKFNTLRERIHQETTGYRALGAHHQDRMDSLDRLAARIEELCTNNELPASERYSKLLEQIHLEETSTAASQKRIGFFGSYRTCRLQKIYLKIINEFAWDDPYKPSTDASKSESEGFLGLCFKF